MTSFAIVGVNDGLTLGKWEEINHDLTSGENNDEKKKFEVSILNKIEAQLKDN